MEIIYTHYSPPKGSLYNGAASNYKLITIQLTNQFMCFISILMGTRCSFPGGGVKRPGVTLTTHLHLVAKSSMCEATPPLPNTPSLSGDQLKHRDNFIFTDTTILNVTDT